MRRLGRILVWLLAVLVLALGSLALSAAWQRARVRHLPAVPRGRSVARTVVEWTDASRPDPYRNSPGGRRLLVWLWYPAAASDHTRARYAPTDWLHALAADHGPARLFMQDMTRVRANAVGGGPVCARRMPSSGYPVIILSTGYGQPVFLYSALAEALAGAGYVVAGIETPDDAPVTVYPDGTAVLRTKAGSLPDESSPTAMQPTLRRFAGLRAQDITFVRQRLIELDHRPGPFGGTIDGSDVYLVGHSLGGAASAAVADAIPGVRAAVDLDGDLVGTPASEGVQVPFLAILGGAENGTWSASAIRRSLLASVARGAQVVAVSGMKHFDFTDYPFMYQPMVRLFGLLGPARPAQAHRTVAELIETFFAHPTAENRTIPAFARSHTDVEEVARATP